MVELVGVKKTFRPPARLRSLLRFRLRDAPVQALEHVDLSISDGECLGIMGENGAGKSTLLRIVAGLIVPERGRVNVCGIDATEHPERLGEKIGYVAADERGLRPLWSPREFLAFFGALRGNDRSTALREAGRLLEVVGMSAHGDRRIEELSTGMRRRIALGRALMGRPELLIVDEPTRGIDPAGAVELRRVMQSSGCTILLATHDLAEAEMLCQRVLLLEKGRVVSVDAPRVAYDKLVGKHEVALA